MLQVDTSRAARSHADKLALVQAVVAAGPGEPETDWVEWKSQLDLTTAEDKFKCAKAILGFGNRDPVFARNHADGCAYFIAGAEPGAAAGTAKHDPRRHRELAQPLHRVRAAAMECRLRGDRGSNVLLVTVEAPREGDPIFTLRRALPPFEEGTIFVRRGGQTDRANAQEITRLTERARPAGTRIDLRVEQQGGELRAFTYGGDEAVSLFEESENARLERWDLPGGLAGLVGGFHETRDPERYDQQVARYIKVLPDRVLARSAKLAVDRGLATLDLVIVNDTDLNFASTQVSLRFEEVFPMFFDTDDIDDVIKQTEPPTPWGRRTPYGPLSSLDFARGLSRAIPSMDGRKITIVDNGIDVILPPVDVRPRTPRSLRPIYLALPDFHAGTVLSLSWRATSTSADGDSSGVMGLAVSPDPVDLSKVLFEATED